MLIKKALRNTTSLIQTIGRAARNVEGRCILYAEKITKSMKQAMEETQRRRSAQELFNTAHNITPKGILKEIENPLEGIVDSPKQSRSPIEHKNQSSSNENTQTPAEELIDQLDISPSEI